MNVSRFLSLAGLVGLFCAIVGPAQAQNGFTTVDMRPVVNMGWRDDKAGDGKGGWTDQGDTDMRNMPVGPQSFLGIPFDIIDPAKNGGKAVLTLRSHHFVAGIRTATVNVGAKAKSLYFLHVAAWNKGHMATYNINYDDGTSASIPIVADENIINWWFPKDGKSYRVAFHLPNPVTDDVGMVIFGWDNPSPDKAIKSVEFKSENDEGIVVLGGLTLSDKPVSLPDSKDIPAPDYLKSDLDTLDKTQWFPVAPDFDKFGPSPIDQAASLDAPAGKHGFMKNVNGHWAFTDGSPARLVATLQSPYDPKDKPTAEYMARWLAKWGFNMVRFHALWNDVIDQKRDDSGHLDPVAMDKIDYFIAELAKRGIYTRFSMLYYRELKRGDNVDAFDESVAAQGKDKTTLNTVGITFFDPKVMQVNIDLEKAIMTHRNPYRGNKMYGEDPAICQIETTNEDGLFFYTIDGIPPHYKQELDSLWGAWLLKKYGTREKLSEAWAGGLGSAEDPEKGTVKRMATWEFANEISKSKLPRAGDQLRFYVEMQNAYFTKTKAALRAAGVKQPINGTCWFGPGQAYWPEQLSNVGGMDYIDRHHYWGGGPGGWQILPGQPFNTETALKQPELILKLGAERVTDLPYTISEWTNVLPNQWRLEGAPLMAFYGNCLGGWDAPIQFAHNFDGEGKGFVEFLKWMWPVNDAGTLCQYPALSQIIRRQDIKTAPPSFTRNISEDQVFSAQPLKDVAVKYNISGIYESTAEQGVNARSLTAIYAAGVGKTGVHFSKEQTPDYSIDLNKYIDLNKKEIKSSTGELYWNYDTGYVTANTPRAQAAVGFLTGVPVKLMNCEIATSNKIASILVTSWDGKPLAVSKHILITAVGRSRNTDMAYSRGGQRLIDIGKPPVLLEGIRGTVTLIRAGACTVTALSPSGYKTADITVTRPPGKIVIPMNGANKAAYYDVVFP